MKRAGGKEHVEPRGAAPREILVKAIKFLSTQAKVAGDIQRRFVSFTEKSLQEIVTESARSAGSPTISILWHDYMFVFFQYFIGG